MSYLLHHGLDESAEQYPNKAALRFQGETLTYAELVERSNQLAHFLVAHGLTRRGHVGIFLNKSFETVIAIYGILKAGGVYVPLDPRSPVSRLETIVHDCDIGFVVSQSQKTGTLQELGQKQTPLQHVIGLSLDDDALTFQTHDWSVIAQGEAAAPPDICMMEDDLAYVMYTSGSTGKPKGIMHTHASGLSYARMSARTYDVTHRDILSNHSALHFDMSTFDYLTGPMCGATTVIIPEAYTLFPANLSQLIQDERMTIWYSVPFALIQLVTRGVMEQRDLSSLRWILYGGEPFPRGHLRTLMTRLPGARVSNVYGPAEVNQCTYYHVPPPHTWEVKDDVPVPLGVVWENAEGLILDEDDNPVAPGEIGELVVRTPTMMQGYRGRPDLNTEAFYRHEIFPDYDAVFYRTGDLVKRRPDGLLDFHGRKDHQVKIRGYRVELAEVDNMIVSHNAIEEGAAYVVKSDEGDTIEAAVIPADGQTVTPSGLISHLQGQLPHYAVPQTIHIRESLPRTRTGKIDRRALQELTQA